MEIKFYKEESGRWYADLPEYIASGGTKEDCEMVGGADDWLDILSQGENEVVVAIEIEPFEGSEVLTLDNTDYGFPEFGATYRVGYYKGVNYSHRTLWLCPVTLFVFGEYPKKMFYRVM